MTDRGQTSAKADSAAVGFASVVNGLAAYAIVVIVSRSYDDIGFASFSVAWSIWALAVAVLIFPLQNWIIWRATIDGGTGGLRRAWPRVLALIALVLAVLFVSGSTERLLPAGEAWPYVLVGIGASSALLGLGRGVLAARGSYRAVAWVIGSENLVRLAVVAGVVAAGLGPQPAALSLSAGLLVLVPFASRLRIDRPGETSKPIRVLAEFGTLAGATAFAQILIQFPPAFAEWLGESPATVSAIFATFAIGRAPILVLLALTTRMTEPLTRFLTDMRRDHVGTLDRALLWLLAGVVLAFVIGLTLGPAVVAWFFGDERSLSGSETALIAVGLTLAMAGIIAILVLLVLGASRRATIYWFAGVALAVALGSWGIGIPATFAIAEAVTIVASAVTTRALLRQRALSQ